MLTIKLICDHKLKHKCCQYISYVFISVNTSAENSHNVNKSENTNKKIQLLCDHKPKI